MFFLCLYLCQIFLFLLCANGITIINLNLCLGFHRPLGVEPPGPNHKYVHQHQSQYHHQYYQYYQRHHRGSQFYPLHPHPRYVIAPSQHKHSKFDNSIYIPHLPHDYSGYF